MSPGNRPAGREIDLLVSEAILLRAGLNTATRLNRNYAMRPPWGPSFRQDDLLGTPVFRAGQVRYGCDGRLPVPRAQRVPERDVRRLRRDEGRPVPQRHPQGGDHGAELRLWLSPEARGEVALLHPAAELGAPILHPPLLRI